MKTIFGTYVLVLFTLSQSANAAAPNVRAWGANSEGQCNVPASLTNAVLIACGRSHNLAVTDSGQVVAWGNNGYGRCNVPFGLTNVVGIAAGEGHSLALRSDGRVVGWGRGELFLGFPVDLTNAVEVVAGVYHSLARKADGTVVAWGYNSSGQCDVPSGLSNVVAIAVSYGYSLALRADGTLVGWGDPGQISTSFVNSQQDLIAVSANWAHVLALNSARAVLASGDNSRGESTVPSGLSNVTAVAAGELFSVVLRADGTVVAWGGNSSGQTNVPVDLPAVAAVSAGGGHCLALLDSAAPPKILDHPKSDTAQVGSKVHLTARAIGPPPLSYQWFFQSNTMIGATNSVLHLYNLQSSQAGEYTVVVSNGSGSVTSQPALLSIVPALHIDLVPAIRLDGDVGRAYRLEYLNSPGPTGVWMALATNVITNTGQYYLDTSAIGQPMRLYRMMQLP